MFDQVNPSPWRAGTYPIRSQLDSTPMAYPDPNGRISSAALHPERCRDRGVSAVPGDTWPTCSLSRGQLCLRDQVDLNTLTAELLTVVHQTVEATASCSGCGRRSPRPGRAALARQREPAWSHSGQPDEEERRDGPVATTQVNVAAWLGRRATC
jgi:hypothetical protein